MSDIGPLYVGRSLLRREDQRLLRGQGQFIADLSLPRMLHAVLVRSPVAHARIRSADLSRAAAAPGIVLALKGADEGKNDGLHPPYICRGPHAGRRQRETRSQARS
jgi:aerobic carbon-monoxide dehydrogenase large subunit